MSGRRRKDDSHLSTSSSIGGHKSKKADNAFKTQSKSDQKAHQKRKQLLDNYVAFKQRAVHILMTTEDYTVVFQKRRGEICVSFFYNLISFLGNCAD